MLSLRSFGSTVQYAGPSAGAKLCPPPDARASHTEMKWTGVIIGIIQSTFSVYGGEKYKTRRTELCKVGVNQNDCNMRLVFSLSFSVWGQMAEGSGELSLSASYRHCSLQLRVIMPLTDSPRVA